MPSDEMSVSSCPESESSRCQANIHSTGSAPASCNSVIFSVLLEDNGDEFVTYVPALDFSSTFGATRHEALERTRELIAGYLEAATIEGIELDMTDCRREIVKLSIRR